MDLAWGDERTKQFVTNVGLITSNGPYGNNIMACEWTHHVSYEPGLIVVCIRPTDATHDNIAKTKEFGISLCASDQNLISSISGGNSGKSVDKIKALKELTLGDHTTFVGKVVEAYSVKGKEPLVYHGQRYWKLGPNIPKPPQNELDRISRVIE